MLCSFGPRLSQHKTIDSVLARGEKLDSLVEKSSDLSMASQARRGAALMGRCVILARES